MHILTIRTERPEAEIGLYDDSQQLAYETWEAHRALSTQLHTKIEAMLKSCGITLSDIHGIVCFAGPGSFTGLRIGLSVGNALAYAFGIPIVAMQDPGWLEQGIARLMTGDSDPLALPHYGAPVHITTPRK